MKEKEILEMMRLIDEGVHRAQSRLCGRASAAQQSLVVCRDGKIMEMVPKAETYFTDGDTGDPLARRKQR